MAPVLGLLAVGGYAYYLKNKIALCEADKVKIASEGIKKNAQTEKQIMRLSDPDLDDGLFEWMRDKQLCVGKADLPLRPGCPDQRHKTADSHP